MRDIELQKLDLQMQQLTYLVSNSILLQQEMLELLGDGKKGRKIRKESERLLLIVQQIIEQKKVEIRNLEAGLAKAAEEKAMISTWQKGLMYDCEFKHLDDNHLSCAISRKGCTYALCPKKT